MGLFKKKTNTECVISSKEVLRINANKIDVLIEIAQQDEEVCSMLKELRDKIKYSSPSANKAVNKIDEKIGNKLDDLKIDISRAERRNKLSSVCDEIKSLNVLIAERKAKL